MITVKKLSSERWKDFRALRLEALQNEPLAFASSPEEEKVLTQNEFANIPAVFILITQGELATILSDI